MRRSMASAGHSAREMQDSTFDLDHEIDNVIGSEAGFYTKEEFKTVVRQFLDHHAEPRRRRTFFFRSDYDLAVKILQDNRNAKLGNVKQRSWVRCTFEL